MITLNITPSLPNFNEAGLDLDTKIMELYKESRIFWEKYPEIRAAIISDIDTYAFVKKQQRDDLKAYKEQKLLENGEVLFDTRKYKTSEAEPELKTGRPRMMTADMILFFLILRGHWGSISTQTTTERIADSMSIRNVLLYHGYELASINTIRETLNKISENTHQLILQYQARYIVELELDDFYESYIDSTAVAACTDFPTDIDIAYKLLSRTVSGLKKLEKFGLPVLLSSWIVTRLDKMEKHLKSVNMSSSKGIKGKTKEEYRSFIRLAGKEISDIKLEITRLTPYWEVIKLDPVKQAALNTVWYQIDDDLQNAEYTCYYGWERVDKKAKTPTNEKVLSISDPDAAYISKGQRNPVIGYRPQIARSGNGFITACVVPVGNAQDSTMLIETVKQSVFTTGLVPDLVSTDDGYSSAENLKRLQETIGVATVSIGGSKGKKLLGEELWTSKVYVDARSDRSAAESGIFTLKYNHGFGQLLRTGIDSVKAELMEKVIAYNFNHILRLKKRRKKEQEKQELIERMPCQKVA